MSEPVRLFERWLPMLPIVTAMGFHAVALERWPPVLAVGVAFVAVMTRQVAVSVSVLRLAFAAVLGMLVGIVSMTISVPPPGLLPPLLTCAVTGALLVLIPLVALARNLTLAWMLAWFLVALSAHVESTVGTNLMLVSFLVTSLAAAASKAGVFDIIRRGEPEASKHGGSKPEGSKHQGWGVLAMFTLFLLLSAVSTSAFLMAANRLDGVVQAAIEGWVLDGSLPRSTGIGDEILIGSRSSIALSRKPLYELSAPSGPLRVNVMDRFDGHRWFTSAATDAIERKLAEAPRYPDFARVLELVLLEDPGGKLPSPAGTWDVRGAEGYFAGGWVLRADVQDAFLSYVGDERERLAEEPATDPALLEVPEPLQQDLAAVTKRIVDGISSAGGKCEAIESFFQDNFEYSLDTDLIGPRHPLVQLVHSRRPAYCVYFASAMAVMLRIEGIPSRVVSGYTPLETNPVSGRVTVRRRDAHAWVEAWLPEERRFVAFDPTPTRSRQQVMGTADSPGIVSGFFGAVSSWFRRQWLHYVHDPRATMAAVVRSPWLWLLLAGIGFVLLRRRLQRRRTKQAAAGRVVVDPELRRVYQRYLRSLRRLGVTPRSTETDDELIDRLRQHAGPEQADKARTFITRYRRARFRGEGYEPSLLELAEL